METRKNLKQGNQAKALEWVGYDTLLRMGWHDIHGDDIHSYMHACKLQPMTNQQTPW